MILYYIVININKSYEKVFLYSNLNLNLDDDDFEPEAAIIIKSVVSKSIFDGEDEDNEDGLKVLTLFILIRHMIVVE